MRRETAKLLRGYNHNMDAQAIKEQRRRLSDARESVVSTARASTPANRQGRRATSYSLGTATIIS
jgi:hypothetical protein